MLAHEISHVRNRDILIGSVAAAVAMGITFARHACRCGARSSAVASQRRRGREPHRPAGHVVLAPIAAMLLQMALSRSREFEADRSGARLIGTGEPLARALEKLEAGAQRIPMNVDPAQAQAYIVNPLTGRKVQFANLFRPTRRPRSASPASAPGVGAAQSRKFSNCSGMPKSLLLQRRRSPPAGRRASCRSPGAGRPGSATGCP